MGRFSYRRLHYLRLGKTAVLPLMLQVATDDSDWLNGDSFEELLTEIKAVLNGRHKELILGKKAFEASMGDIQFRKGATVQFAYYFEARDDRCAILVKKPGMRAAATHLQPGDDHAPPAAAHDAYMLLKYCMVVTAEPVSASRRESTGSEGRGSSLRALIASTQAAKASGPKSVSISSYFTHPAEIETDDVIEDND